MSRNCFAQIAHLLSQAIAQPTSTVPPPPTIALPQHTGFILPFPPKHLPKALYSDRPTDTAFDAFNISGAAHRERRKKAIAELTSKKPAKPYRGEGSDGGYRDRDEPGSGSGGNGTSWEKRVEGVDGWDVGYEKFTQMFVKRKGRGVFRFERAVQERFGGFAEEDADE